MVGLGVMGRNLLLNMADHGHSVAGYDKDATKVAALRQEAENRDIRGAADIKEFIALLRQPRAVMMLVPAGPPVDSVINDLLAHLQPGDLIIDAGNSYFKDTDVRARNLKAKGLQFLGVGVSGGEEGARHGPSIMPGGPKEAYERVRPVLEAVAARVNGDPCVTWLGPGSAGHFVKMVHNGIEYGVMQLLAEAYDLMKRGLGMNDDEMGEAYALWNKGELNGYLVEITSHIFSQSRTKRPANGSSTKSSTWPSRKAPACGPRRARWNCKCRSRRSTWRLRCGTCPCSRRSGSRPARFINDPSERFTGDRKTFLTQLSRALFAGMIITYAQGMALLAVASDKYEYHLDLEAVARIWRGGCIIRAALLEDICAAFHARPDLPNLLLAPHLSRKVMEHQEDLRRVVCRAAELGIPAPGLMVSLGYLDAYRSAWLPANLIQAQRDYFGAHTYERIDAKGTFHTEWEKE